ncbi:MAG: hypothetical protein J4F42_04105 [Desulfurellaceae bacterium]|nr:hypothetical protein [Desulfurellaceae bacterium]
MKKSIWMMFAGLLFSALPAFATIQVSLENPASGTSASGVTVVSGWAFSDSGAAVTVSLRVNGKTTETTVLCCGPRQDVKDRHAAAPLNSGFGLLWNYGALPSGVHTIGVEVSAEGEESVIADSSITVVRPADAEFLESLSIDNARVDIHDGEIHITEAEATPTDDTSVKTDLTLSYHVSRQGFGIDMAQDDLGPMQSPYDALELLEDVAHAIFATYDALNEATIDPEASTTGMTVDTSTLHAAVHSFVGTSAGSQAAAVELLPAVQAAWRNTRVPWEQSEAFLFGPVDSDEHDPFLDTWPLNVTDLENIIASSDDIATLDLADDVQGFHALEYLLFQDKNGSTDPAAIVAGFSTDERRRTYARTVAGLFARHTQELRNSWDPAGGDFVHELALAGRGRMTYTDQKSAVQELVNGMIGIADELGNVKIGVPLNDQSTAEEESRFSNNSRRDFIDNVRSINNVYEGRFDQHDGTSTGVTDFVANQDPALDAKVRMAIRDAMTAVIAIPEPFGQSIMSHRATVQAAVEAAQHLQATLEEILPVVQAASFTH